jgi:DNA-binding phage protein
MDKKKTLKEQEQSSPKLFKLKKGANIREYDPMKVLLDKKLTLQAILECLSEGDVNGAKEVFLDYLWAVNKAKLAKESHVSRSTIVHCLQHKNPTLDTFLKVMAT